MRLNVVPNEPETKKRASINVEKASFKLLCRALIKKVKKRRRDALVKVLYALKRSSPTHFLEHFMNRGSQFTTRLPISFN